MIEELAENANFYESNIDMYLVSIESPGEREINQNNESFSKFIFLRRID